MYSMKIDENISNRNEETLNSNNLDEIIRAAEFPEDYDAFDDEQLDMIP
ncbi:MAG: hypothetical protein R3Y59_05625 [bacterium]